MRKTLLALACVCAFSTADPGGHAGRRHAAGHRDGRQPDAGAERHGPPDASCSSRSTSAGSTSRRSRATPAAIIQSDATKRVVLQFIYGEVSRDQMVEAFNDGFKGNAPKRARRRRWTSSSAAAGGDEEGRAAGRHLRPGHRHDAVAARQGQADHSRAAVRPGGVLGLARAEAADLGPQERDAGRQK